MELSVSSETTFFIMKLQLEICPQLRTGSSAEDTGRIDTSVYSTRHLSSSEDKNFPFCPQLRTRKMYGKQTLLSKLSTIAYLTMVVLPSWQLLTQYYTN